jgi:hypothetical protein
MIKKMIEIIYHLEVKFSIKEKLKGLFEFKSIFILLYLYSQFLIITNYIIELNNKKYIKIRKDTRFN